MELLPELRGEDGRGENTMKDPQKIKVLVACEESQRVCMAFRDRKFEATRAIYRSRAEDTRNGISLGMLSKPSMEES